MQRKVLIVDDHDDLKTALTDVFTEIGFSVEATESRDEAVEIDRAEDFDLVITDLDGDKAFPVQKTSTNGDSCLPQDDSKLSERSNVKAFKICATHFRRENFDEDELKNIFETILNYKSQFVDKTQAIQNLREKIEFEFPSTIKLMHSILDYLVKRVEKIGVVNPERSNLFVALDEAFVNAVKHGNKFDANKIVRVIADVTPKEARFTIEDEGEGFDVSAIPDPTDIENLFKTSGRGVMFMYNIMDEVVYNEKGNRITMVKKSENPAEVQE